jgi:DNA-binding ferritin-like protein
MKHNSKSISHRQGGRPTTNKTRKHKSSNMTKKQIVRYMLQMLITVKLYHWNTLSFSVHKATDDLYGELNTLIDQFVEVLLGKGENVSEKKKHEILNTKTLHLKSFKDNGGFKKEIDSYKRFMINLGKQFNQSENSDILNVRDEILATLNKMSYLLTLK